VVGGDELGWKPSAVFEVYQNLGRLLDEIESARNDVTIGRDGQAGRGTGAHEQIADPLLPAEGFNPHHRRSDPFDGRFDRLVLAERDIVIGGKGRCGSKPKRRSSANPVDLCMAAIVSSLRAL
jgi:hypothetical protein